MTGPNINVSNIMDQIAEKSKNRFTHREQQIWICITFTVIICHKQRSDKDFRYANIQMTKFPMICI